jgi:hypothetical protein
MHALALERITAVAAEIPIPAALRTEQPVFEERLAACEGCDALREKVLCAYCGCFILFRARIRKQFCPHPLGNKWPLPADDH